AGKRQPGDRCVASPAGNRERKRRGGPKAQAVEAIHQLAGEALAGTRTCARDRVRRAVLVGDEVRKAPPRKNGETETSRGGAAHGPGLPPARHPGVTVA